MQLFLGVKKQCQQKTQKIHSRRKSQDGKQLQIWVGYLDWGDLK